MKLLSILAAASIAATAATARDQIRIVGSSTVFPFSTAVAEQFGKTTDFATPVVESTGSGGGIKLFCAGVGESHPDMTNSSRRMKAKEFQMCQDNGVTEVVESVIGYDGIVIANSKKSEVMKLSRKDIFLALAKQVPAKDGSEKLVANPYKTWKEVNPALPADKIEVLGPPPTSGTRDAFAELALEGGCKTFDWIKAMKKKDKKQYKTVCHSVREDGAYIEAGENDNLIVQKLAANPDALGIFGYSFLEQNADMVQGSIIDGVAPEFDAIADGDYPVSRSLYFYVKNAHVETVPGIAEFLAEFANEETWGEYGYLAEKGLIPMGEDEMGQFTDDAANLTPLSL